MFFRFSSLFLIVSLCFLSCKNTANDRSLLPGLDSVNIKKNLVAGDRKLAFTKATAQLDAIRSGAAPIEYIRYNQWLASIFSEYNTGVDTIKIIYANISSINTIAEEDPLIINAVCNASYKWAEISLQQQNLENDAVITAFEKALQLDNRVSSLPVVDKRFACKQLGIIYTKRGDNKKALQYYGLQKKLIPPDNHKAITGFAINAGITLAEINQVDSAISLQNNAIGYNNIDPILKSNLLITLSSSLQQKKEFQQAEKRIKEALQILDTISSQTNEYNEKKAMALKQQGLIHLEKGKPDMALLSFRAALSSYNKNKENSKRDIAKLHIAIGNAFNETDNSDSALWYYQFALRQVIKIADTPDVNPDKNSVTAENVIMESCDGKATVFLKQFDKTSQSKYLIAAINAFEASFLAEQQLMESFSYDESRLNMLVKSKQRSEQAINTCYTLYKLTNKTEWAEMAFQFAEKSKAVVLKESIRRNIATNENWQKDTSWQKAQHYKQTVSYYEKEIATTDETDTAELNALQKELGVAEKDLLLARNDLKLNEKYQQLFQKDEDVSLPAIQKKLVGNRTTLLEYFYGDSIVYLFKLSGGHPVYLTRIDEKLFEATNIYLSYFADKNKINNEPLAYEKAAHTLFQALQLNSLAADGPQNLIIIPDGMLCFVPFESLVTKISGSTSPKQFAYLLLNKQISYGFSAVTLIRQAETLTANKGISCFAPVFAGSERGNTPLLNTSTELNQIKKEKKTGNYFLKENASIVNFKKNIDNSIIHIASHAHSDTSGSMPVIEFYDSTLYLNEIYTLPLSANLVVLSACETGIGKIDKSEGSMSLARSFYYAGAKNIITSLWSVDDKSTGTLFANFYHILGKENYSSALRESKLAYLHNASETAASPYYWAGFIHIGHSQEENNRKGLPAWMIIVAAGILLLIFFGIVRKKK